MDPFLSVLNKNEVQVIVEKGDELINIPTKNATFNYPTL